MNILSHIRLCAWNTSKKSDGILMMIPLNSWRYQWETLSQKEMITICDRSNAPIITSRSFSLPSIRMMLECFYNANIQNHFYPGFQNNKETVLCRMDQHHSSHQQQAVPARVYLLQTSRRPCHVWGQIANGALWRSTPLGLQLVSLLPLSDGLQFELQIFLYKNQQHIFSISSMRHLLVMHREELLANCD